MIGNEVWKLLNDIASKVFGIDLSSLNRNIYGYSYVLNKPNKPSYSIAFNHFFGLKSNLLKVNLEQEYHSISKKAAVAYNYDRENKLGLDRGDVFLFSDVVLEAGKEIIYGTLLHELCHYIVDGYFKLPFKLEESYYKRGKLLKVITRFSNNDKDHSPKWFALLYKSSHILYKSYPGIFHGHEHAAYSSIFYDIKSKSKKIDYKILLKNIKWLS